MRHRAAEAVAAALAVVTLLAAAPLAAEPPDPPPYYAIRDARVVTGAGATLERATVLLADGLIEAVGTDLAIPADAWVIEGEGLVVYPGLIDAWTTLGQQQAEGEGGDLPGRSDGPEIRGPEDRPKTTPWVSGADQLGEDGRIEKWREAGFTAAVTAPADGIFAGQAAVIHLGRGEPRDRVLAAPVAQRVNLERGGFRAFPGSLMGVIAYVEQTLADSDHYREVTALYASEPRGRERPAYDRALAPLAEAMAARTPFVMPGDLGREIDRVLKLARAYNLRPVVVGAQGAYDRAAALAGAGAAAVVSLDWPEAEKDRDPDADTDFRDLYHRRMAPTAPAALTAGGVPLAFTSAGLASPSEVFEGVRRAIEAGLDEAAALRALSAGPAEIFGIGDRLGTIERGKIANLVVATAPPWAEDAEIEAVFVDGRHYAEREPAEDGEPPATDVSGSWAITLQSPRGARDMTAKLEMDDDGKVTGEITGERGATPLEDGKMSGDLLRFKTTRSMGERSFTASWSLTVEGDSLSGTMSAGPMAMDVSGERTAAAAEEEAEPEGGAEEVPADELRAAMARYQGPVRRMDRYAVTNATVWTVTGDTIPGGTVLVEDGRIRAVGAGLAVPAGFETVDAGGGHLVPGIIDAHAHIAIEGGVNEGSLAVTAMVQIGDVIDPDDIDIYRALAGGVTAANLLHGSSNPIGGQNAVIKLRWGADADGLLFAAAPPGIKFALGENPKRSNFRSSAIPPRYPATRMGVMDVIRQAFTAARAYRDEWRAFEAARGRRGARPTPPRRDLKLEALVEILEGKRLVHSHCYRADEILQLLRLAEEFGFRIASLQHVLEGYKVADEIAAHGAGASTFSDWWGYKVEAYDAIPHNAALMAERGVVVSINSDSAEEMRHLNQEAAKTIHWGGLDERSALALVTLNPAIQLGIAERVGSIEVGKDADLVLYDGHPLAISSLVQKTFVDGDLYFDRAADRERQALVEALEERLAPAKKDAAADEAAAPEAAEPAAEPPPERRTAAPFEPWWRSVETETCREEGR